ncbi:hypothetical protein, conserved [Babesia bigemina]|uniref:C3H1-type domain-containing protein n=1 Tax=Babesia bigemina TaxID=5866 RepID=A0A061BQE0_BABBI|nr:hypothetical protein, conserved [Babesia bigemina]CDR71688.1 hypothetical protein, conserved [Babesia bigemina]|eukprot:XP_012770634.1 hypothetical protein, conserved [Babesia bigemina]
MGMNLSQALKKLIEEAIEKAEKSLTTEKEKLSCPFKYSDKETYCQYYQSQIKKTEKPENAGKSSQELVKENLNLSVLKDCLTKCQAKHKDYPTSQAYKDIESRLDQLKKLEESLTGLTKEENCKNLLTNLCDGLETFLGFDPKSKGYDGSGIVYSDLDRLCDGVMGFLSGVLDAVKDDPSVKTYYKGMDKTLKVIEKNMHKTGGLSVAVEAVSTALGEWDNNLTNKINETKNAFNNIKSSHFTYNNGFCRALNNLHGSEPSNVAGYLGECITQAGELLNTFNIAEAHYKDLDSALRDKLKDYVFKIKLQVEKFHGAATNEELKTVVETAEGELAYLQSNVNKIVDSRIRTLKTDVTNKTVDLKEKLTGVSRKLKAYVRELYEWKRQTWQFIAEAIKNVDGIVDKGVGFEQQGDIKEVAMKLRECMTTLGVHIDGMKFEVAALANKALKEVKSMDEKLKQDLWKVKDEVGKKVTEIKTAIGKLYKVVESGTENGAEEVEKAMLKIMENIRDRMKEITGPEGGREHKGLIGIAKKVAEHTGKFKSDSQGFEKIVKSWVDEIVDRESGLIKHTVLKYINYNRSLGHFGNRVTSESQQTKVLQALKERIKTVIASAIESAVKVDQVTPASDTGSIQLNITALLKCINGFSDALETKIKNSNNVAEMHVSELAKNIEQSANVMDHYKVNVTDKTHLYDAVKSTLDQVLAMSRQRAADLQLFAQSTRNTVGTIVDTIRPVAESLHDKLKTALGKPPNADPVTQYTNHAADVDSAIEQVKTTLGEQLLSESNTKRDSHVKLGANSFNNYKGFVKQEGNAISDKPLAGTIDEGTLPAAIGDIRKHALQYDVNPTLRQLEARSRDITDSIDKLMNALSDKGTEVNKILLKVKDIKIGKEVKDIVNRIFNLQQTSLSPLIKEADELMDLINVQTDAAISDIKCFLGSQVTNATRAIQSKAKHDYYAKISAMAKQMEKQVDEQIGNIEALLSHDLATGVKGLLKAMYADNGKQLNSLKEATNNKNRETFGNVSQKLKLYIDAILFYLKFQVVSTPPDKQGITVSNIKNQTYVLLTHLGKELSAKKYNYDNDFVKLHSSLSTSLHLLSPSHFANPRHPELLDAVKKGLQGFVTEMGRVYVNGYDSETFGELVEYKKGDKQGKLTSYGRKCSKLCLTVLSILNSEFETLLKYCLSRCKSDRINKSNDLGKFFVDQGYNVSEEGIKQWELQDDKDMTGFHICKRLFGYDDKHIFKKDTLNQEIGPLKKLHDHLQIYYRVGHIATSTSKRRPCNIFEMLCWLSGLPCNYVFDGVLHEAVSELFVDPRKQPTDDDEIPVTVVSDELPAYPEPIELVDTQRAVKRLCSKSYDVLIKIVGYGDAYNMYAVDFCDNSSNLHYPADATSCLELLVDILRRLLPVFRFLHSRCELETEHHGWAKCLYGRDILTGKSQCNKHPADKQTDCLPRSPLQSYLSDSLPGHLPHNLTAMGCKSVCSNCPKSLPGQPCLTPLGFRGFTGSTKTGKELGNVLGKFFNKTYITSLLCLLPKPPSTLPEHFQFAISFANMLNNNKGSRTNEVKAAFDTSTKEESIDLYKEPDKLTTALQNAYCNQTSHNSSRHSKFTEVDLSTLSADATCIYASSDKLHCAPYLKSLCDDSYTYLAERHSKLYLSWALYLPWTLHKYLKSLLDAFSNISCRDWGCRRCMHGTKCTLGKHGVENCQCKGLVECRGVTSTFYSYGFRFSNAMKLMEINEMKYCHHFYIQLKNIIDSNYFIALFKECDNFLWIIRQPFIWLNVALWLLSFLYLLHIMVIRLDLLHIKSHLRSPSSHRIAAQSLLAAGRVNKLNRVFYLQP